MRRAALLLLTVALWPGLARGGALVVGEPQWGFDGRVVPGRVNLLSVAVTNTGREPIYTVLRLHRGFHSGGRLGAPLERRCDLSPGSSRWVQFFPYVHGAQDAWTLELADGTQIGLKGPTLGPPGRVFLRDPAEPLVAARLPVLPDNLFPPTVSATDGLHSVALDHDPQWEPARRQAFLDWLRRGGELHLLHDLRGRYPVFSDLLAPLNAPLDRYRVGAGLVVRHPLRRSEVTSDYLVKAGFAPPALRENDEGQLHSPDGDLLSALTEASRPRHSWALIYLTVLAYVGAIGIYHFFYARKQADWRRTMALFGATVVACSLLLGFIGKRGQGEAAAVNSIAYARHLGGDQFDVTQWQNVFVTSGALYTLSHAAPLNIYSTCQSEETVAGLIRNGKKGGFVVDIPLFSSRAFLHRGKLQGHRIELTIREWESGARLRRLVLEPGEGFPTEAPLIYAVYRNHVYRVGIKNGLLTASANAAPLDRFLGLREIELRDPWSKAPAQWDDPAQFRSRTGFGALVRPIIAHALGGTRQWALQTTVTPDDRVQLFVVAKSPAGFRLEGRRLGERRGYTVYHLHLFEPETLDGPSPDS